LASAAIPRPVPPRPFRARRQRSTPEGIRITAVGLWFVLLTFLVAVAATYTGNNALYTVLALMFAVLIVSGVISRQNVRGLAVELAAPGEIFANRPFSVGFRLENRGRLLPRWFLLVALERGSRPLLIPFLPRRGKSAGKIEALLPARGRAGFPFVHVSALFPFGFFRKGERYRVDLEVLVFPELFPSGAVAAPQTADRGEDVTRRIGRGTGLHSLRGFRSGDDPRGIHWKQTARTGGLVFMEREAEESRRLSVLFDNAVGPLDPEAGRRFERLVSEAATVALQGLEQGLEVELVTRDGKLGFGTGARQRFAILETLALIAPREPSREPLAGADPRCRRIRFELDRERTEPLPPRDAPGRRDLREGPL
jgi:uncharacterized protein (DUF58 family)